MSQPHKNRRSEVHFLILAPLIVPIVIFYLSSLSSCRTPKYGCPNMAELKKPDNKLPWLKNTETGLILVTDMDGKIVCSYFDKPSK